MGNKRPSGATTATPPADGTPPEEREAEASEAHRRAEVAERRHAARAVDGRLDLDHQRAR